MTRRKRKKKSSIGKKVLLGFLSFICILVLVGSIVIINLSSKINTVEINRSFVTDTGKEPIKEEKDVITVALLGSDYSGTEIGASDATMILSIDTKKNNIKLLSLMRDMYLDLPDGGKQNLNYTMVTEIGASDATMILSIDTKKNNIKLLSLMRDMYLDLPDGGKQNLNYTMVDGGPELLLKTINYNFNLQVDKFVHVSLHTLPIIIDKLGGVELEITNEELDFINSYINSIDFQNGTVTEPLYSAGRQVLNGTQAAAYCRIRYTEGRDYKRTERQRDVLSAIFDKFKNDFINSYINSIDFQNGTVTEPLYSAGRQVLNGTQAAAYCRIRYTEGRDYKRTERQRDVLSAIFDKFKNISITEVPGLINDLLPLVSTNMTTSEMLSIATKALGTGVSNIEQGRFPLDEHHYAEWTDMYSAIFDKFKNISITEVPGLINDLLPLVSTNMTTSEMLSIATKALGTGVSNIEQGRFPLDEHHYAEWTDMYHMIIDIDATTEEIHKFIYSK